MKRYIKLVVISFIAYSVFIIYVFKNREITHSDKLGIYIHAIIFVGFIPFTYAEINGWFKNRNM